MSTSHYTPVSLSVGLNSNNSNQKDDFGNSKSSTNQWSTNQSNEFENREKYMETKLTEENFVCDLNLNTNQTETHDDGPLPPPGLRRLVTGQTVSFDDVPSSPPFDRVVPGEGNTFNDHQPSSKTSKSSSDNGLSERFVSGSATKEHTSSFQPFIPPPPPPKKENTKPYGNTDYDNDNIAHNSTTQDFFDGYLRPNSSSHDLENTSKVNQFSKNKFASLPSGFHNYDAEKREAYYQSAFNDNLSVKSGTSSFQNYPSRPSSHLSPELVTSLSRSRDDVRFKEDNHRRHKEKDPVSGRYEKNRKKPLYNRRDRHKMESDEDEYDESINRIYDNSPERESHSYRDKRYHNSPRRVYKRSSRRERESSYTQDDSYYDDDDDDYDTFRNQRGYYERNYRDRRGDYYGRFEDNHYFRDLRNSRPSSRTGSEYRRDFIDYSNPRPLNIPRYYRYLDHRSIVIYGGELKMYKRDIDYWSKVREVDPKKYMNWFKITFPKEYAQWYSRYVMSKVNQAAGVYQTDRRGSGHSGESSLNNDTINITKEKVSETNHNPLLRSASKEVTKIQEMRTTPVKFALPHIKGIFNNLSQLVVSNPSSPQDGQAVNIDIYQITLREENVDFSEFMKFTGPFIVGETHVNTLSDFLKHRASIASSFSEQLLYLLIDLIIKLRGVTDGIAISELLMNNYRENHGLYDVKNNIKSDIDISSPSESSLTKKYMDYLLQGDKKGALEWAIQNKMWGHAFLLASKIGPKYYNKVLVDFDKSMSMNNPLKTMYQLYSRQIPQAATACSDEKWGDWRPHLAMMLSNPTNDNEFDKIAILTLGNSLSNKDIFAAHFCYLSAQIDFEPPNKSSTRYSLLTLPSSIDSYGIKISNHSILLTQIYEFAKRLQKKDFTISALMPYKYLLAVRLIDYGKAHIALQYLESIALDLIGNTVEYDENLAWNILELAEKLKYSDAKSLDADSSGEKLWLADLRDLIDRNRGINSQVAWNERVTDSQSQHTESFNSQAVNEQQNSHCDAQQPLFFNQPLSSNQPIQIPFQEQERRMSQPWESNFNASDHRNLAADYGHLQELYNPSSKNNEYLDINDNLLQQMNDQYDQNSSDNQHRSPWDPPSQPISMMSHTSNNYFDLEDSAKPKSPYVSKLNGLSNNVLKKYGFTYNFSHRTNTSKTCQIKRLHRWGNRPIKKYIDFTDETLTYNKKYEIACLNNQIIGKSSLRGYIDEEVYDFYRSMSVMRYNSLCNSKIVFNGTFPIDKPFGIRKRLNDGQANSESYRSKNESIQQTIHKNSETSETKDKEVDNGSSSSWLGGIFGKLSLRPKNEMKLPEGKNQPISWNEEQQHADVKCDDGSINALLPPPEVSESNNFRPLNQQSNVMMSSTTGLYQSTDGNLLSSHGLNNNMYKLTKGKGMKTNYVNVLSQSTTTNASSTAAMLDPYSNAQIPSNMKMFVPMSDSRSSGP